MITQYLKNGLFLCKKNFQNFVQAWNLVQARSVNLKGDGDVSPDTGYITVDNSQADHPVIRFKPSGLDKNKSELEEIAEDIPEEQTLPVVTTIEWDTETYRILAKGYLLRIRKGLIEKIMPDEETEELRTLGVVDTTPLTEEEEDNA